MLYFCHNILKKFRENIFLNIYREKERDRERERERKRERERREREKRERIKRERRGDLFSKYHMYKLNCWQCAFIFQIHFLFL